MERAGIDPEIVDDRDAKYTKHITLSYTFYEIDLPEDVQAAQDLSPEDRDAMIRGMVARLENRLAEDGGPPRLRLAEQEERRQGLSHQITSADTSHLSCTARSRGVGDGSSGSGRCEG